MRIHSFSKYGMREGERRLLSFAEVMKPEEAGWEKIDAATGVENVSADNPELNADARKNQANEALVRANNNMPEALISPSEHVDTVFNQPADEPVDSSAEGMADKPESITPQKAEQVESMMKPENLDAANKRIEGLKNMTPEQKDKEIASIMMTYGVEVKEENGVHSIVEPKGGFGKFLNHVMGGLTYIGMLFNKISKAFSGKKTDESNEKDSEKDSNEKSKEKPAEKIKQGGISELAKGGGMPIPSINDAPGTVYTIGSIVNGYPHSAQIKFDGERWQSKGSWESRWNFAAPFTFSDQNANSQERPAVEKWNNTLKNLQKINGTKVVEKNNVVKEEAEKKSLLDRIDKIALNPNSRIKTSYKTNEDGSIDVQFKAINNVYYIHTEEEPAGEPLPNDLLETFKELGAVITENKDKATLKNVDDDMMNKIEAVPLLKNSYI